MIDSVTVAHLFSKAYERSDLERSDLRAVGIEIYGEDEAGNEDERISRWRVLIALGTLHRLGQLDSESNILTAGEVARGAADWLGARTKSVLSVEGEPVSLEHGDGIFDAIIWAPSGSRAPQRESAHMAALELCRVLKPGRAASITIPLGDSADGQGAEDLRDALLERATWAISNPLPSVSDAPFLHLLLVKPLYH